MRRPRMRVAAMAVAVLAAVSLAACGNSGKSSTSTTNSAGTPVFGGTLRWVASGDVDHLDPMPAYSTSAGILARCYPRQLLTYPSSHNYPKALTLLPDLA